MLENFKQTSEASHWWFSYQAYLWGAPDKYSFRLRAPYLPWDAVPRMSKRHEIISQWGNTGSHGCASIVHTGPVGSHRLGLEKSEGDSGFLGGQSYLSYTPVALSWKRRLQIDSCGRSIYTSAVPSDSSDKHQLNQSPESPSLTGGLFHLSLKHRPNHKPPSQES